MSDGDKLIELPPHENMTPEECLTRAARRADTFTDVIVIGYDANEEFCMTSSHMARKDVLWLMMLAIDYARGKYD